MMTVYGQLSGQRSSSPDSNTSSSGNSSPSSTSVPFHQPSNGYNISQVYSPHGTMNRSWNGLIFQVSPLQKETPIPQNGYKSGTTSRVHDISRSYSEPEKYSHNYGSWSSSLSRSSPSRFVLQEDDTSSYSRCSDTTEEEEYVTLDNNYIFPPKNGISPRNGISPVGTRHMSIIDFKRNQLNSSVRSEQVRIINNHIHLNNSTSKSDKFDSLTREKSKFRSRSLKRFAENIGAVLSPNRGGSVKLSPNRGGSVKLSPNRGDKSVSVSKPKTLTKRRLSKSVGDLRLFGPEHEKNDNDDESDIEDVDSSICYSDDDDGDDFGFLSSTWASSSLSLAMSKSKSSPQTHKILAKKLRSKTRPLPGVTPCTWSPQVSYIYTVNRSGVIYK